MHNNGSQFLLLLNEDDGDNEWQKQYLGNGIPYSISKQLSNCRKKGRHAKEVDFGPTGAWYINGIKRDGSGSYSWWGQSDNCSSIEEAVDAHANVQVSFGSDEYGNESFVAITGRNGYVYDNVDHDLSSRIERINNRNEKVDFVRLFSDGGYYISDDSGSEWNCGGSHFTKELKKYRHVCDVALAEDGSWVIIGANRFSSSQGVSDKLTEELARFYRDQGRRNEAREAKIRRYREQAEQKAREQAERERIARETAERDARERAEEKELLQEVSLIGQLEEEINSRRSSVGITLASLPPSRRARVTGHSIMSSFTPSMNTPTSMVQTECVVCQDCVAQQALIPCGHHCLCDDCATSFGVGSRCPLCRGYVEGTLKIFNHR